MKRGIVVSDIHCGSIYGMLPPDFETFEGVPKPQNAGQEYLWKCWLHFVSESQKFKPDFVIVNGDVMDGLQQKNKGSELSLLTPQDQSDAAVVTLQKLKDATPNAKWYFTQGTPYHVGVWGDREEFVAKEMDAVKYSSVGTGRRCREVLWLETDGVIVEAAHHISVAAGFYRLTPLDREMQWSALSGKDWTQGIPRADIIIRSHVHFYSYGEHASKQGLTTPCWQLQTRYMRKNSVHRMHPNIGGIFLTIDGRKKEEGEAPCVVTKKLYKLPPIRLTGL